MSRGNGYRTPSGTTLPPPSNPDDTRIHANPATGDTRTRRTVWMSDTEWQAVRWAAAALERVTGEPCSVGDYVRRAVAEAVRTGGKHLRGAE